jgi:hypothetical protein
LTKDRDRKRAVKWAGFTGYETLRIPLRDFIDDSYVVVSHKKICVYFLPRDTDKLHAILLFNILSTLRRYSDCTTATRTTSSFAVDMDFSQLNSAEQAHMSKVIEKKQVLLISWKLCSTADLVFQDARLLADVLESSRAVLQLVLQ